MAAVVKSISDPREYKVIHLENGLTALLIADTSSVSLHRRQSSEGTTASEGDVESEDGSNITDDDEDDEMDDVVDGVNHNVTEQDDNCSEQSGRTKETKLAAAALCIGVGSFSDPDEVPGLAHFLEHMVFMGSNKYPDENAFDAFIKKHGGSDNASTDCERTIFQFDVRRKYFKEALDRFAQFFISPLLKEGSVEREIQAVDSEFRMSYQSDTVRKMQLLAGFASTGHPFGKFLWGSEETLQTIPRDKGIDVQGYLRDFQKRAYSAQYMTLTVISRDSLDTLEKWVKESFSDIPNNGLAKMSFEDYQNPFDISSFHKMYKIVPVKEIHQIELNWVLPPQLQHYRIKPLHYVSWLLGHEGPGSVLSLLIKKSWAVSLLCGNGESGQEHNTSFALFPCLINLTDDGIEHVFEVLTIVFQYLAMLRCEGPQKRIYDEIQTIEFNEFRFQEQREPCDYVEDVVENMQLYPAKDYLTGNQLMWEFDEKVISSVQDRLTPQTTNIMLLSKGFKDECTENEAWFQTPYSCSEINPDWLEAWSNLEPNPELHLPEENRFIATDFEIKQVDRLHNEFPEVVLETPQGRLWHLQDTKFKTPRARYCFHLISPLVSNSLESVVLTDLFVGVLVHNLKEVAYAADVAQLSYSVTAHETGIVLKLDGFSHKLGLLFEVIVDHIANFEVTEQTFQMIKRQFMRSYSNAVIKPHKLVRSVRLALLQHVKWTTADLRSVIPDMTLHNLINFASFKSKLYIESLVQGNITSQEAISLQEVFYSKLQHAALRPSFHPEIRVVKLPDFASVCRVTGFNKDDENSVVTNYYQSGPATLADYTKMELLMMKMEEPCFDVLRTREQLGYSVFCTSKNTYGILGFSITVQTQAEKFSVEHVDARIDAFVAEFVQVLKSTKLEDFKSQVDSLIELKQHEDLSLSEEVDRNWLEVFDRNYLFNRQQKEIEVLKKVTPDDLYEFFTSHIVGGSRFKKLSVQIVGSGECEKLSNSGVMMDCDSGIGSDDDWVLKPLPVDTTHGVQCIADIAAFKRTRPIYPVSRIK